MTIFRGNSWYQRRTKNLLFLCLDFLFLADLDLGFSPIPSDVPGSSSLMSSLLEIAESELINSVTGDLRSFGSVPPEADSDSSVVGDLSISSKIMCINTVASRSSGFSPGNTIYHLKLSCFYKSFRNEVYKNKKSCLITVELVNTELN